MASGPTTQAAGRRDDARRDLPVALYVPATRERSAVTHRLKRSALRVEVAASMTDALQRLAEEPVDMCLIDLADDRAAIPMIRMLTHQYPATAVVAVADPANPVLAAEALESGVADVLPWPFDESDVSYSLANARERTAGDSGDAEDAVSLDADGGPSPVFCQSPAMQQAVDAVRAAGSRQEPVAMCGESGSGRELLARSLHDAPGAATSSGPFVLFDCSDGAAQELEARLFGMAAEPSDALASAGGQRLGRGGAIVAARSGTLFLRNLAEAPARVQTRLARLLRDDEASLDDDGVVVALGVRAVAAFDPEVDAAIADGRLRQELVDRFKTRVEVPPLRRRREDIPLLAVHLLRVLPDTGTSLKRLSRSAVALLAALPWPGNGHELHALLDQLARTVRASVIQLDDILEHAPLEGLTARIEPGVSLRDAKARFERDCISAVLVRHRGRVGEAAKALGIQRTNLYRKIRQLNVAKSLLSARK